MNTLIKNYFSAANSYRGFVSRFESSLFSDDIYKSVIVKGGCGTGKSTLMRKIADYYEGYGDEVERIYCSSDPTSVDGIIIYHGDKKLSIADCTAPHEYDARLPGIKDIIINTAEGIINHDIEIRRKDILTAFREKKNEYKLAYFHLRNAGVQFYNIIEKIANSNINTVAEIADSIIKTINTNNVTDNSSYLVHSFSRCGFSIIEDLKGSELDMKFPDAVTFFRMICIKEIEKSLVNKGSLKIFIDPLSQDYPLAIKCGTTTLTASNPLTDHTNIEYTPTDEINEMINRYSLTLEKAKDHFEKASYHHFKLEEYYSESMDFEIQKVLFDKSIYFLNN